MSTKPKKKPILLTELLKLYLTASDAERAINSTLAVKTREHYAEVVRVFGKFMARPATTADLNAVQVNAFLRHLFVNAKSEYTIKNRRTGLRLLWKFAHRIGYAPEWADVQNVRINPLNIQGFNVEQITKLVEHTSTFRGTVRNTGLPKRMWWETFLVVNWETGIRCGDMFNIAPEDFDKSGWLWIVESKTGKRGWRRMRDSAAELLLAFIQFEDSRYRIWPGYLRRNFYRAFSELCDGAGVEGSARWIRRGSASEVEKLNPGAGWKFLRHSEPTLFDRHYRVDRIVEESPLLPPGIKAKVFRPEKKKK